ncbi:MAG TPA: methylenetetrahydrofolate--tRNA-(uracil(54)-C(5))-methyltransferase (FADH(2)-oxidizing) TrmFO [Bdellovibrionales bacterium]|nr:methylenetetrahydrofolate--tRNA-(uracil(54)-C(5))-methyltransferase (FADH(2)-oxidizing) TrmFO [Bdellovibrionales bacterium]
MQGVAKTIHIVGGGLAGSECALQLADRGHNVVLYEMRSATMTPAHKTGLCAELVCSNSFGTLNPVSAPGQLKWEAEQLGSHILKAAKDAAVPAGQALGIDRALFAQAITDKIKAHPRITLDNKVIRSLNDVPRPAVIATGPLTHPELAADLQAHFGSRFLYFFDAIAPIIDADTIDYEKVWRADRYDKGTPDYLNCPLSRDAYFKLMEEIKGARKIESKDFEKELEDTPYFEGCMPIEAMVERGDLTLAFGPMKPKGLKDPRTGREPFAVVQLRQENKEATSYNMVGFQTKMAYGEQTRIFRMIPGLENAEFLKLGSIHRNLYIHTPNCLRKDLSSPKDPWLFFAGQITGVEGYFDSTVIGLLVARTLDQKLRDLPLSMPPRASAMGSLLEAITEPKERFQPTNINFGLFPNIFERMPKDKKKERQIAAAREAFSAWLSGEGQ